MPSSSTQVPAALSYVAPAAPVAGWLGGKRNLAKRIIARIEAIPHDCYGEPFLGMGGVFLRRSRKPRSELVNDISGDVVNLFRVMKEHRDELLRQFDWTLSSRAEFRRLVTTPPEILTDVQRAARFAYLQRLSFSGKPAMRATPGNMAPTPLASSKLTAVHMQRLVTAVHRRLQGVHIECLGWAEFIQRYDRPFTLFYIDPPYWGHEDDYGKGLFASADFVRMAGMLHDLKGRFLLSLNDRPEVRQAFAGFQFEEVMTSYTSNPRNCRAVSELLISSREYGT